MPPDGMIFVGQARSHLKARNTGADTRLRQVFPADPMAVREALREAMVFLRGLDFGQDQCGPVELVLAEAINNVVEHAYAGQNMGVIEINIDFDGGALDFLILDDGLPMPQDEAPDGQVHDLDCDTQDLPEGGFGWFLIRELTRDLTYSRSANRNRLQFSMDLADPRN